ncbi:N-acetyl-anhydromuranmyl-L-alanine amidase [compost metagenome]
MKANEEWNPLVPTGNRIKSTNFNQRKPASRNPSHIVIHVTGTKNLASVKNTFTVQNSVSAHYLVDDAGHLFQFVPDAARAFHSGIDRSTASLYRKPQKEWQKYLKYFSWYKRYPQNSIYLDGDLNPVWDKTEAAFVALPDGKPWDHFQYFNDRWSSEKPINFDVDPDPNNYSIGIETLGIGSSTPDPTIYSDAMYIALRKLVSSLCEKYKIPNKKGIVVGHEDVNPIGRFGWDPARGFEWDRVHDASPQTKNN